MVCILIVWYPFTHERYKPCVLTQLLVANIAINKIKEAIKAEV